MLQISHLCGGIYLNEAVSIGPEYLEYEGLVLRRFMDMFYIRGVTEDLEPAEVSTICKVRAQRLGLLGPANMKVHQLFKSLICRRSPRTLLEIGAGVNPVMSDNDLQQLPIRYVKCDADASAADGVCQFSESVASLPYPSESFDMAIAVFVLHFRFCDRQVAELYRCLSSTGVFVANVYRRGDESLRRLAQSFEAAGFVVAKLLDPKKLCEGHQYWVCSKDPKSAAEALAEIAHIATEPDPT